MQVSVRPEPVLPTQIRLDLITDTLALRQTQGKDKTPTPAATAAYSKWINKTGRPNAAALLSAGREINTQQRRASVAATSLLLL